MQVFDVSARVKYWEKIYAMSISPVNIDQVQFNIDSIVSDIKLLMSDNSSVNLNLSGDKVDLSEFENACKILGCGRDYNMER